MNVLVTGVTGFVGAALVPRLLADGHAVRGFARDASRVDGDYPVVEGDACTGAGLHEALRDIDVVYFLLHAMEGEEDFDSAEREMAENVVAAAREQGVPRVVYLGGLTPQDEDDASPHLASRHAVERVLLEGFPEGAAFRASIVIGAGSRSFDVLADLVERLPVLALPAWRDNRTRPIDVRDVIEYLARAATLELPVPPRAFEIGGATELTYGEMVTRIGRLAGHDRPAIDLPFDATPLASRLAAAVTGEDAGLVGPLMESLKHDLVADDADARERFGVSPRTFDDAVGAALRERAQPTRT